MSEHHHRHDKHRNGKAKKDRNEGEGNRTAARDYNDGLQSFLATTDIEPAAREAKQFVDSHPAEASAAERKASEGPAPIRRRIEELISEGRAIATRLIARGKKMIERARAKAR